MFEEWTERFPVLAGCESEVYAAAEVLLGCFKNGSKLLVCGNGGSCADSGHIAGELMKGFRSQRSLNEETKKRFRLRFAADGANIAEKLQGALPVISLPDQTAVLTAFNNDADAVLGYAQLVYAYAKPGDVLLAISTSGNSENVVNAARTAVVCGAAVIALTGKGHCMLDDISDVIIHVPETDTAHIQELHLPVYHALCAYIEKEMFR